MSDAVVLLLGAASVAAILVVLAIHSAYNLGYKIGGMDAEEFTSTEGSYEPPEWCVPIYDAVNDKWSCEKCRRPMSVGRVKRACSHRQGYTDGYNAGQTDFARALHDSKKLDGS